MNNPVKFHFGEDFDRDEHAEEERAHELVLKELRADFDAELIQEKQNAFEEGFAAGQAREQQANEVALQKTNEELKKTIDELNIIVKQLLNNSDKMTACFEMRLAEYRNQSVQLATEVAEKLSGVLIEKYPLEDLEIMFRNVLNFIEADLRVSVVVPGKLLEEAEKRIRNIIDEHGHKGRLNLLVDDSLKPGDWKVEWGAGGLVRNIDHIKMQIDDALQRYVTGVAVTLDTSQDELPEDVPLQNIDDSGQGEEQ